MWTLILLDNRDCHVKLFFQPVCLSSSGCDHCNIRKIQSQFFSMVFVSSVSKLPLFFSPTHPFSSMIQISYSSILLLMGSLSILFPSIFLSGDSHEDFNGVSSAPLFVLFLLRWNQFKLCWSYPFLVSNTFSCRCTSYSFICRYSFVPECWRYLRRLKFPFSIRSSFCEDVTSFKPFIPTSAISLLNRSTVFLLSGP